MTAIVKHISVHPKYRRCRVVGIFDDLDAEHRRKNPQKPRIATTHRGQQGYVKKNDFGLPAFLASGKFENFDKDRGGVTSGLPASHPLFAFDDDTLAQMRHKLETLGIDPKLIF